MKTATELAHWASGCRSSRAGMAHERMCAKVTAELIARDAEWQARVDAARDHVADAEKRYADAVRSGNDALERFVERRSQLVDAARAEGNAAGRAVSEMEIAAAAKAEAYQTAAQLFRALIRHSRHGWVQLESVAQQLDNMAADSAPPAKGEGDT